MNHRYSHYPVLRHSDPVMDCGQLVGHLRVFDYRNDTTFDFTPSLAGLRRGFVYRESESFARLWKNLRPAFYNGRKNWNAGNSGGNQ